ncbi:helix-turn-helix domain-containing protein [Sagittula sp. SSi028]|uniref:helix-turn-helix domain-containing protein n=1 Tax=Sagittula sp. SSi028 TaxID=3400636 RepID=UPI003AF71977
MIGRKTQNRIVEDIADQQGFDGFDLKLGDVMRGERATLGKSLLDVQRELRIKASYIAAIENCDPNAFDTPGFIAGYVRSYARYLGMDPDEAFAGFCQESGFSVAHGMSSQASVVRKPTADDVLKPRPRDTLANPTLPFAPASDSFLSQIEPRAVASSMVLLALIGGIGYGGWAVLQEVQRVQVTPVDQTPVVLSELDPLDAARAPAQPDTEVAGVFTPPTTEAFDRLYRPQALDVPVLIARDEPISTLDPDRGGLYSGRGASLPSVQDSALAAAALADGLINRAQGADAPVDAMPKLAQSGVSVLAVRPAWVQVSDASGKILMSRVMNAGERFAVPGDAQEPRIQVGESGAVYFSVQGEVYGPAGQRGAVTSNLSLAAADLTDRYDVAQVASDEDLATTLAALTGTSATQLASVAPQSTDPAPTVNAPPRVTADLPPGITVVATQETWVEVTAPSGKKIFAQTLQPGQSYQVPQTDQPATIFSGNAGGVYFAVNGQTFGPYGQTGQFGRNLALSADAIAGQMQVADLSQNQTLARAVAELSIATDTPE